MPVWAEAIHELDDALYFLDICAVQAGIDAGMILGDIIAETRQLLDEVDHRVAACEQKVRAVADAMMREEIEHYRTRKSGITEMAEAALRRFSGTSEPRMRDEAVRSMAELRKVEEQIRQASAELRKHCLRYQGIKEAKETAENAAAALWRRLASEETQRRSGKFVKDGREHEMSFADASATKELVAVQDSLQSTASTAGYVSGEKVHIWSKSQGMWCTDGVVKKVLDEDAPQMGYVLPAGSVQVMFSAGEKWVTPDQFPHVLRRPHGQPEG
ncbi:CPK34 [Symbiodinium natans]|uniref:CPK34 protein n=1 Tax=Symbiodinium natans TaxID=878477 RepID=A0A812I3D3_9DINO|nr:CPK34 [Symbiodinium natans]